MTLFRIYLVVVLTCLTVYTLIVGSNHGWNLLPIFFSDIGEMKWPGQFNFDFTTFLSLSGIWVAWRHRFTLGGIISGDDRLLRWHDVPRALPLVRKRAKRW